MKIEEKCPTRSRAALPSRCVSPTSRNRSASSPPSPITGQRRPDRGTIGGSSADRDYRKVLKPALYGSAADRQHNQRNIEPGQSRDAVLKDENPDRAASMIQQLAKLRGIGVQSATVLVREGFVREFANCRALGSYAGLSATPYSSGGTEREQGIRKAGNILCVRWYRRFKLLSRSRGNDGRARNFSGPESLRH
jgi:hypothetical protein